MNKILTKNDNSEHSLEKKETKFNYITILSVVSAFFVVCLHQNASWTYFSKEHWWFVSTILMGICYPAVPVFFMITGANLMDYKKRYDTKTFFKKRIKKILVPFLAWSIIAIIYKLSTLQISLNELSVHSIFNGIINTKFQDTYWFFPVYISIILIMPLFASIDEKYKKRVFMYLAIIWFIFDCVYPLINNLLKLNIAIPITVWPLKGYIFYCVIGYLLHNYEIKKKFRYVIYFLGILSMLSMIFGTYFFSMDRGKIDKTFLDYLGVPCAIYAISIFVFIKNIANHIYKYTIISKLFNLIGKYTFAIYLLHNTVRNFVFITFHPNAISIYWRVFCVIPVVAMCMIITWILRKIPIVKKIVP